MAEDLSKLSSEDIRRFEKTISEVKAITARQEEIAKKVLEVEQEIGKVRLASLTGFFDEYSRGLDAIVARKTSQLGDAFLVMEQKAADSLKKTANSASQYIGDASSGTKSASTGSKDVSVGTTVSDNKRADLPKDADKAGIRNVIWQLEEMAKKVNDTVGTTAELENAMTAKNKRLNDTLDDEENSIKDTLTELLLLRKENEPGGNDIQKRAASIKQSQETWSAELGAQRLLNKINIEREMAADPEMLALIEQKDSAVEKQKVLEELEAKRIKYIAQEELKLKRKNNGVITADQKADLIKKANEEFALNTKNQEKLAKQQKKKDQELAEAKVKEIAKQNEKALNDVFSTKLSKDNSIADRFKTLTDLSRNDMGDVTFGGVASVLVKALGSMVQQLEQQIDDIASGKSAVDTRLQGSSNKTYAGSYWDQIVKDVTSVGAINPFFKQEDFSKNIKSLVDQGIAFDLEQRAFLMTIQDKIATTFNVADGTLLRLIRIQQEDSTAGRLGMEASLNAFLNNMYENTEYLKQVASGVRSSLEEMQSLMEGAEATEVEYQVQKWLGSLYSVGMSQNAVQGISGTLGQIAAGQIEGLTNGGAGNLLIMAANDAGLSIADILTSGIDSSDTNKLMKSVVNYLAEIAESSKDNNVVQQQLAEVFGVKASDLRAATNLAAKGSVGAIYDNSAAYGDMLGYLFGMAGTMGTRTSIAEMMSNIWKNTQYTLAGGIASSPVSYGILKAATLLDEAVGGIPIPDISIMGNSVALNTTVADLLRVGALGGGIISSFGSIAEGLGNSFSGQAMLSQLGISSGSGLTITPRGGGTISVGGGVTSTSSSGYVGNSSSSDIKESTIQESNDYKKQLMVEAQEESEANQVDVINTTLLKIYELLDDVAHGSGSFSVKVEGYGLTKASSGAQGGVSALGNLNSSTLGGGLLDSAGSGSSISNGGVSSSGIDHGISFGGWTTTI